MRFDIYMPCDMLKPYVRHFAVSEADGESTYKVLPDTSLVIGFQYRGGLSYLDGNSETALSTSGLTGLRDSYRIFKNSTDTGSVLVFFREAGATAFFKEPIHEFFRESLSLDHFMLRSELMVLEENLCEAGADDKRIAVIEQFLISRLRPVANDELVTGALALIHSSKGNIRIKDLATHLHTSQSPLEKRFRQAVGTSPKKFASIVRFKHSIQQYDGQRSLTDLGYDAGFYDQAHFIKDFRNFTGENPEAFFSGK